MSTQIAVRLPEELVAFVDRLVSDGRAPSRAAVVTRALHREVAARDAAILAAAGASEDDMDALAEHAARIPLTELD